MFIEVEGWVRSMIRALGRLVRNAAIDLRFGAPLAAVYLRDRSQSNSDYRELASIFDGRIQPGDVLVDVGCGAGRVINQWLRMGMTGPIYGLELDERIAARTSRRLRRRGNVTIISGDAVNNLPADGDVFFLFNPFDEATTRRFADAVKGIAIQADRDLKVIYLNCKHLCAFADDDNFDIAPTRPIGGDGASGQPSAIITVRALRSAGDRR